MKRLDSLAYALDNSIRIPGTGARVGLDAVIGLIPGIGDAAGTAMSAYIVIQAARIGAPVAVILRMLLNVGLETVVGAVPLVGDLFDAGWKANARNMALLRRAVDAPGATHRSSRAVVIGVTLVLLLLLAAVATLAFFTLRGLWNLFGLGW
jgi:hypothetical protein